MKYYLSDLLPRLKKYSAKLDQTAFIVDKPWVVSSDQDPYEKLIFRNDGRVHLSSNGNVTDGQWEYLPEAQSLLIDYGDEKKLYNHQYLDEAVLALKQDGTNPSDKFFLLANENTIPDTNAKKYLRNKYLQENNIEIASLGNEKDVEIRKSIPNGIINGEVKIHNESIEDGKYLLKEREEQITVRNGKIRSIKEKASYPNGIFVWQEGNIPSSGEEVIGLNKGTFKIRENTFFDTYEIFVEDGSVTKVKDIGLRRLLLIGVIITFILTFLIYLASFL